MNTPSHLIMTAVLGKTLGPRFGLPRSDRALASGLKSAMAALLLGSVAPDLPLYLLSLSYAAWYHWLLKWPWRAVFAQLFNEHYFYDPVWICLHNLLHAPLLIGLGLWLSWRR